MKFLQSRHRFTLYFGVIAALLLLCGAAIWGIAQTGAYLTSEGDWQDLAGDYRIGTIDYTIELNDELLMGQDENKTGVVTYELAVPLTGGVRIYDPTVTPQLRKKEFNEGATRVRVRLINRSSSMVDVATAFTMEEQSGGAFFALPLPTVLTAATAKLFDQRAHAIGVLGADDPAITTAAEETAALAALTKKYGDYLALHPTIDLPIGLLPGALKTVEPDWDCIEENGYFYAYRDVFFTVWSEYGAAEYNAAVLTPAQGDASPIRQARLRGVFSVGQVD